MPMYTVNDAVEVKKIDDKAFKEIKSKADVGDSNALNILGCLYYHGHLVTKDEKQAFQCFQKTASLAGKQNPDGAYNLVQCYLKGIGTDKNSQLAFETLLEQTKSILIKKFNGNLSSDPSNPTFEKAIFDTWFSDYKQFDKAYQPTFKQIMADSYLLSIGTKEVDTIPIHEQAIRFYTMGLKDKSLYCEFRLAMYYFKGKCLEKNPIKTAESALNVLQKVASSSDAAYIAPLVIPTNYLRAQAYHQMGIYYLSLEGGAKDPQKANDCFNKAYQLHPLEAYKTLIKPEFKEEKAKAEMREKAKAEAEAREKAKAEAKGPSSNAAEIERLLKMREELVKQQEALSGKMDSGIRKLAENASERAMLENKLQSNRREQIEFLVKEVLFPNNPPQDALAAFTELQKKYEKMGGGTFKIQDYTPAISKGSSPKVESLLKFFWDKDPSRHPTKEQTKRFMESGEPIFTEQMLRV